jgi:formamidopyrimidine-DNA glycosylase
MPELPEVENFRRLLLPLVSKTSTLTIDCPSQTPPRTFLTPEQVKSLNGNCRAKNVLRKGKLICVVLECVQKVENQDCTYIE